MSALRNMLGLVGPNLLNADGCHRMVEAVGVPIEDSQFFEGLAQAALNDSATPFMQ